MYRSLDRKEAQHRLSIVSTEILAPNDTPMDIRTL
jgi:hypothetical protein